MSMVRQGAGVAVGLILAAALIAGVEAAAHATLAGDGVFAAVALGYGLGAAAGTWAAGRIAGRAAAAAIPVLLAGLALANLLAMAHPLWFVPAAALALALGWYAGRRLGGGR